MIDWLLTHCTFRGKSLDHLSKMSLEIEKPQKKGRKYWIMLQLKVKTTINAINWDGSYNHEQSIVDICEKCILKKFWEHKKKRIGISRPRTITTFTTKELSQHIMVRKCVMLMTFSITFFFIFETILFFFSY